MAGWDDSDGITDEEHRFDEALASDSEQQDEDGGGGGDSAAAPASDSSAAEPRKPGQRRRRPALTRSQVLSVLDVYRALTGAPAEALTVLKAVVKAGAEASIEDLTALALTQDRGDNPLATIAELRAQLAASPFTVPAIIAGMDRGKRGHAFAVLAAAMGADSSLPSKDVDAAVTFAQRLSELTGDQIRALEAAQELQG